MQPEDLPDGLSDRIKAYGEQENTIETFQEAHLDLLERGLADARIFADGSGELRSDSTSFTIATPKAGRGLHSSLTFSPFVGVSTPVRSASMDTHRFTEEDIEQALRELQTLTSDRDFPTVHATISQVGGEWYVGGASEILDQLTNIQNRRDGQADWETHKRELVTIVARTEEATITFGGQATRSNHDGRTYFDSPWISVVTNGYPVTGEQVQEYAERLGLPVPETATPISMDSDAISDPITADGSPQTFTEDDVIQPITYGSGPSNDSQWVSGAMIENPFTRPQLERLLRGSDVDAETVIDDLLARDRVVVNYLDHHPLGDDEVVGYNVERLRITDLSEATEGRSGTVHNVEVQARYVEKGSTLEKSLSLSP